MELTELSELAHNLYALPCIQQVAIITLLTVQSRISSEARGPISQASKAISVPSDCLSRQRQILAKSLEMHIETANSKLKNSFKQEDVDAIKGALAHYANRKEALLPLLKEPQYLHTMLHIPTMTANCRLVQASKRQLGL